jgi:hypothetical protein
MEGVGMTTRHLRDRDLIAELTGGQPRYKESEIEAKRKRILKFRRMLDSELQKSISDLLKIKKEI